ncbi:hypothetical protein DL770_010880 [Monosporascus sp. CRB-9-2]|nr:hypothetical protein DL770_010880 [Monosporascus sp. CRB-9-2]
MVAYPWIKSSDNTYEQKYGFIERFFARFLSEEGKPSQFTIMATVEFCVRGSLSQNAVGLESRLRQTWRAMRYYSPSLAALSGPDGRTYHVPGDESLADWENTTFKLHAPGVTAEKLFSAVERTGLITLHFLPNAGTTDDTHQLVLQAEHQNIDGRGTYYFFNRFFTIFTTSSMRQDIHFGDEWSRLPPMMDDLLSLPITPSERDKSLAAEWISPLASVSPLGIPIPPSRQSLPPTHSLRSVLPLSQTETTAVIAACKSQGLTVTSAWVAGLALSLAHFHSGGQALASNAALASFAACDMRRYFPSTFDPKPGQVACYHAAIPTALRVVRDDGGLMSFRELAGTMKKEFHGGSITEERGRVWGPFVEMAGEAIMNGDPRPERGSLLISSLGVEDDYVQHEYGVGDDGVEVVDVWIGDTMMSAMNLWMCHTWDGRLNLSVTYNGAYFEEEVMEGVLGRLKGELLGGLGVVDEW